MHEAVSSVTSATPAPFVYFAANEYYYNTTIPIPSECTVLIHAEVQFDDPGDVTKNILSHHEVSMAYETAPGVLSYLQVKSVPYTGTHVYPKGPLKFDVNLHNYRKSSISISIMSPTVARITDLRYSLIVYDMT